MCFWNLFAFAVYGFCWYGQAELHCEAFSHKLLFFFTNQKKLSVEKFTSPRWHKGKTWTLTCYQASEKFTSPRPYKGKTLTLTFYQASEKFTSPRPYKGKTLTLTFYQASEKFTSPSRMLMMKQLFWIWHCRNNFIFGWRQRCAWPII